MEKTRSSVHPFKRILSLALAFVLLLGMVPVTRASAAEGTTLYLEPNSNWLTDSARFAIYYWNDSGSAWADMSGPDKNGIYEGTVPTGYSNVIFCRMSPATTDNNWDNKWNQSSDLTVPTDGTNCYTVADGTWDKGGGSWSLYGEEPEEPSSEATTAPVVTTTPDVEEDLYIVAGVAALCGSEWDVEDTANKMSLNEDGTYSITYANVAPGTYGLKVTDGTWTNSWGDNGNNYTFVVSATCDVTVTFDPATGTVSVTGDYASKVTTLEITSMTAVGNGSGNWLNGASWDVGSTANAMTETSEGIYEITFQNVPAGTAYEFKFAANGAWDDNWGGGGAEGEAVYNGQNIALSIEYDLADVTLKLDLSGFDYGSKSGATYTVTVTEVTAEPEEPAVDYYLIGNINGANYGCDEDYENLGEYKFVDGKLTATFTSGSYVFVKTGDNTNWFMTNGWLGTEVTSAILYNTNNSDAFTDGTNKLFVPGGVEVEFTLTENEDGTLTLSYAEVVAVDTCDVTLHFFKTEGWGDTINAWVWDDGGALPGYEQYQTAWPGSPIPANANHAGWYDLTISTEEPRAFYFIFNDGASQTANLYTGEITGDTELWVVGDDVMSTAPGEWSGDYDYTAYLHFQKPEGWADTVNAYLRTADGAIPGYEAYNAWPGVAAEADAINSGWYNVAVTMDENAGFYFIFNDGTNQTADLTTGSLEVKTHLWIVDGVVLTEAPAGWKDPSRTLHVPGTFPGPSWDAASNQMSWDAELGLYVYTFENVPPANYEYKIAVGGSWNENYGAGGVRDGANIAVTVTETTDVTIYYNDETHNSVTSVSYIFADVTLSGTGIPEGTKLTDKGLTGIYSVTVPMTAGTYTDLVITCGDEEYAFAEIKLEEDKDVTFFLDPITGIFYCDASEIPVDSDAIYFDSQDEVYKQPFGAVATGEEVTFSIDTGADITSAVLVVKGIGSYPMTAEDTETGKRWSASTTFSAIGEYDYYFSLSNGSSVAIYSDDDGYYGEGQVTELTDAQPYDLVVYKAGFETPDWMKDAVIYQIFPDRFFDGDVSNNLAQTWARGEVDYEYITDWYTLPENPEQESMQDEATYKATGAHFGDGEWSNEIYGGDLEGITERIGYLKALGVNVIYLNPIFWSISNHRYDAVDYTEIDPILGTMGDFRELVAIAEANDMHIILDGVFNHVSDDSVYFDRYYKFLGTSNKIGAYPYWAYVYDYMADNTVDKASAEAAAKAYFSENYGITDWSYTSWFAVSSSTMAGTVDNIGLRAGKEVYSYEGWWGYDSMPIIYSTNGSEYQTGNWAQEIIYNANETSVTQYWISQGNNGWRLDVANEVSDETWQRFRDSVKSLDSDAVIIGEIWDDATKYLKGDMYDSVMNYLFRNAATSFAMGSVAEDTMKELEKIRERYPEEAFYAMMNLVGSHDTTRLLSYLDGIGDDRSDKSLAAAFPTYEDTSEEAKQMQYLVAFLQFTYAGAPTIYYGDEIGMVGADDPDDRRAMEWGKGNRELVEWYAKLAAIRAAYPALRTGSVEPLELDNTLDLLAYIRRDENNTVTVIANNAFEAVTTQLEGTYVDLISGETYTDEITVPACGGVILVNSSEVKTVSVNYAGLAPAYDSKYIVAERPAPEHTHKYEAVVTDPTCTESGYTTFTCECGDSYVSKEVPALGHSEDAVVTDPTCTEKGFTTYTCTVCGEIRTDDFVDALGHSYTSERIENLRIYTCERCSHSYEVEITQIASGKSLTLKFIHPETNKTISGSKVNWEITEVYVVDPNGEDVQYDDASAYATLKNGKLSTKKCGDQVYMTIKATLKADETVWQVFEVEILPAATLLSAYRVEIGEWGMHTYSTFYSGTSVLDLNGRTEADGDCLIFTASAYPFNADQDINWKSSNTSIARVVEDEIEYTGEYYDEYLDDWIEYTKIIPVVKVYPVWNSKTGAFRAGTATITATAADGSGKKVSFKVEMTSLPHSVDITMKDGSAVPEDIFLWNTYEWNEETGDYDKEVPVYAMKVQPGKSYSFKANLDTNASKNKKKVTWDAWCESGIAKMSNGKVTISKNASNGDMVTVYVQSTVNWEAEDYVYLVVESDKIVKSVDVYGLVKDEWGDVYYTDNVIDVSTASADNIPYGFYYASVNPMTQENQSVTWSLNKNDAKIATIQETDSEGNAYVAWIDENDSENFGTIREVPENAQVVFAACRLVPNWDGEKCKTGTVTLTATAVDGTKQSVKVKVENLVSKMHLETKDGRDVRIDAYENFSESYISATAGEKISLKAVTNDNAKSKSVTWYCNNPYAKISSGGVLTISKLVPSDGTSIYVEAMAKDGSYTWARMYIDVAPRATNVHLRSDFGDGIMKYVSNSTRTWDVSDGETLELSSLVYPFRASQAVNWTVSNKNIATVEQEKDEEGKVTRTYLAFTGKKFGKLTVTATAKDGSKVKSSFTLNVIRTVQNMELPGAMVVTGGKTAKLAGKLTFDPTPTVKEITWSMQMAEFAADGPHTMVEVPAAIATLNAKTGTLKVSKKLADYAYLIVTARDEITGVTAESYITLCPKAMTGIVLRDLDGNVIKSGSTVKVENGNVYPFTIEAKNNTDKTYYDCVGWNYAFSGDTSNYDIATVGIMQTEDGTTVPAVFQQTEAGKVKVTIKALDDSGKSFSFHVNFVNPPVLPE